MASSRLKAAAVAAALCAFSVYAIARADVWLRARSAYLEGEKHMAWAREPRLKAAHGERMLQEQERRLRGERAAGRIDDEELRQRLALARFARDEELKESELKQAVVWFQTVIELFTPPESRWSARARSRLAEAKALWKLELDAKKIPYRDDMLE